MRHSKSGRLPPRFQPCHLPAHAGATSARLRTFAAFLLLLTFGLVVQGSARAHVLDVDVQVAAVMPAVSDAVEAKAARGSVRAEPAAFPPAKVSATFKTVFGKCPPKPLIALAFIQPDDDCPADDALDGTPEMIRIDAAPQVALVPYRSPRHAVVPDGHSWPALHPLLRPPSADA